MTSDASPEAPGAMPPLRVTGASAHGSVHAGHPWGLSLGLQGPVSQTTGARPPSQAASSPACLHRPLPAPPHTGDPGQRQLFQLRILKAMVKPGAVQRGRWPFPGSASPSIVSTGVLLNPACDLPGPLSTGHPLTNWTACAATRSLSARG